MQSLGAETKQALCKCLEESPGGWESLAHTLRLGILTNAFRLSPRPACTLLDSYEVHTPHTHTYDPSLYTVYSLFSLCDVQVSGGTVCELLAGLKSIGNSGAVSILQERMACEENDDAHDGHLTTGRFFH